MISTIGENYNYVIFRETEIRCLYTKIAVTKYFD